MNETEEIKNKIRPSEFIGGYLPLRKAGQNYKGLCPFHQERTPSFMVSDEKQIYHCFGCGEGGDVISFYEKIENVDFITALTELADRAGVQLKQAGSKDKSKKDLYTKINEIASIFYQNALKSKTGASALGYLNSRGLSDRIISEFRLGYAPNNTQLIDAFLKKGYQKDELVRAGIALRRGNGLYDRFAGRIVFPIANVNGKVVGFTARVLDNALPKYVNSPETEIYRKSDLVYGLDKAKKYIKEKGYGLVVEGNMDVVAAHQAGVREAVAISGTAFTDNQVGLISRYAPDLYLALDTDNAGVEAAKRAIQAVKDKDVNIFLVTYLGKDPAEAISANKQAFISSLKHPQSAPDFIVEYLFDKYDANDPISKKNLTAELLEFLHLLGDVITRGHYLQKVAEKFQIKESDLRQALQVRDDKLIAPASSPTPFKSSIDSYILELMLKDDRARKYLLKEIDPALLLAPYQAIVKAALTEPFDYDSLRSRLEPNDGNVLAIHALRADNLDKEIDFLEEAIVAAKKIKRRALNYKKEAIRQQMSSAQKGQDKTGLKELMKKLQLVLNEQEKL